MKSPRATGREASAVFVSISFANGYTLEQIAEVVDREGASALTLSHCQDLVGPDGPPAGAIGWTHGHRDASLACRHNNLHRMSIDRWDGKRRLNTAVLLDRAGRVGPASTTRCSILVGVRCATPGRGWAGDSRASG